MTEVLLDDAYFRVEEHTALQVVTIRRKGGTATLEEIAKAYNAVTALVRPEHQSFGLVLDSRESAGRNDPEFESLATNLRAQADASFARVVVLVATAVGELQVRRMAKSARHDALVTRDETEAMQLARG